MNSLNDCIIWRGHRDRDGYGRKMFKTKQKRLHRVAWEWANGPIPEGMLICHTCDNPPCVNPLHLFLGTHKTNSDDKIAKGRGWQQQKTHCPQNHSYSGENLTVSKRGFRVCKTCARDRSRATRKRIRDVLLSTKI